MERIGSFVYNAGVGVGSAAGGATEAAQNGVEFGFFWASKIAGALDGAYRGVDKALYTFFMDTSPEDETDVEDSRKTVHGDGFGDTQGTDVILRVEVSRAWELKIAKILSTIFALVIAGLIIALGVIKGQVNFALVFEYGRYFLATLIVACILEALCIWVFVIHLWNIYNAWRTSMVWSRRRLYISSCSCIILGIQIVNLGAMIAGIAVIVSETCRWRNRVSAAMGFVQWTCWNLIFLMFLIMAHNGTILRTKKFLGRIWSVKRVRGTSLMMDAPVRIHVYKVILVVFFQLWPILIFQSIFSFFLDGCDSSDQKNCTLRNDTTAYVSMMIVSCAAYLAIYWYYSSRAAIDIDSRSYAEMKLVRVIFGLQHSFVMPLFLVLMVSIVLLTAINLNSCWTYVQLWLGLAPLQAASTLCCIILSYFYMPVSGRKNTVIFSFLQDLAWTESSLEKSTLARNKMLEYCSSDELVGFPMFCAETSIRHMYIANFVYSCDPSAKEEEEGEEREEERDEGEQQEEEREERDEEEQQEQQEEEPKQKEPKQQKQKKQQKKGRRPGYGNLTDALWVTQADSYDIVCEPSTDTLALLTWSSHGLWISFKGTSSSQNVKTDMNFLKTVHPPARRVDVFNGFFQKGVTPFPMQPRVHRGFYQSWTGNGFNEIVLEKVRSYMASHASSSAIPINITGHSLGGSLATLCAFDLFTEHRDAIDITVYTFGQPRVGNRAFSVDYDAKIVKHFSVIHDQDPIVRIPKGSYKRNGHRVIVNQKGDLIISPNELEMHVLEESTKIKDHFLEGYRKAWMSILKQQFGGKQFVGIESGREGATRLCNTLDLDRALMGTGLDVDMLRKPEEYPQSEEDIEKKKRKKKIVEDEDGTQHMPCMC